MSEKNNLPDMLNIFKDMFTEEQPTMDALINYEVLVLTIEAAIDETSNSTVLGEKIKQIMSDWTAKNQDILKSPKNKKTKHPKIELLNSEGPILVLKKENNKFCIYDEWKQLIAVLMKPSLMAFINGKQTLTDSRGRVWKYTEQSEAMKPSENELINFINQ
jgi:hypothetical protein